jgi:large subunit ribosomal protein L23
MSRSAREILIRPIITEETSRLEFNPGRVRKRHRDKIEVERKKYAFEVAPDATKIDVRRAVEEMFEVEVKSVRTMNCIGKKRRMGRTTGRRPHWKKAIVTLAEGAAIDVYEGT